MVDYGRFMISVCALREGVKYYFTDYRVIKGLLGNYPFTEQIRKVVFDPFPLTEFSFATTPYYISERKVFNTIIGCMHVFRLLLKIGSIKQRYRPLTATINIKNVNLKNQLQYLLEIDESDALCE